jgi:hypothetical protein
MTKVTKLWEPHHSTEFWDEIVDWCVENFGPVEYGWRTQATMGSMDFMFKQELDAELFILKWM